MAPGLIPAPGLLADSWPVLGEVGVELVDPDEPRPGLVRLRSRMSGNLARVALGTANTI